MARHIMATFAAETGAELIKSLRAPEFFAPTLALPVTFYLLFGILLARSQNAAAYLLATFGVFAVMGPALFGFGVGVAAEREKGWLSLKRTAPASGAIFIAARLTSTLLFAAMALVPIYAAAGFLGGVALPRGAWSVLLMSHVLAAVPFSLMGLALGFTLGANAAVAVANLLFLALAVLGGLWFPVRLFPETLQQFAWGLPSFHLAEVSLSIVNGGAGGSTPLHLAVLAGMTALLAALAGWCWSRQR